MSTENENRQEGSVNEENQNVSRDGGYKSYNRDNNYNRYNNDGEQRQYRPRTNYNREGGERPYRSSYNNGERPSYNRYNNGERPQRPRFNSNSEEGGERQYRPRTNYNREGGEQRQYRPRTNYNREGGEQRPYSPRPRTNYNRESGEQRPYTPRPRFNSGEGGEQRPYSPRPRVVNLSRAYTLSERYKGNKVTLPIGRVKTPTLALVVRRERELAAFKPVDYFTVKVLYNHPNGVFWATWQPTDEQKGLDPDGRLINKAIADELVECLQAGPDGFIKGVTKSKKKDVQRLPLSLSSLQVLAGKAFSYDPQTVLDTAQKLYEKKLTTYPRSDCEYLPPNQYDDRNAILNNLQNAGDERLAQWAADADRSIKSRAWNEKKITAHHAIIPTTVACNINSLSQEERNIYFLISQAYIAQFYGEHIYEQTKIVVEQCKEEFVANGRVVIEEGWKLLYKRHKSKSTTDNDEPDLTDERGAESDPKKEIIEETDHLPAVKKNDTVLYTDSSVEAKQTKPPSRFTPSTLLQAMKEIHKFVKNEDLKKQLKAVSGIGTEATRANIIDELISRGFMKTSGKKQVLSPTETGYLLVDALPEELLYPDETAVWEERLALMSEGEDTLDSFLADQINFLQLLIDKLGFDKVVNSDQMMPNVVRTITSQNRKRPMDSESVDLSSLPVCPKCKKGCLQQRNGKFGAFLGCTNYPRCKHTQQVEGDSSSVEGNIEVSDEDKQYKCPRCNVGYFVKQEVRGRTNWICSNRSQCKTQCSDVDGVPSIYANK